MSSNSNSASADGGRAQRGSERLERLLASPGRRRSTLGFVVAVVGPVLVSLLAFGPAGTAVPALLYLLTVVAAAAVGRLWPGLLAAALSFIGLDYFFTEPVHTFAVSKAEDLFALAMFLVVAAVVSGALSAALEQRAGAEFREHQMRALYHVTSRLLSGDRMESVLADLAASLRSLYGLTGCRVMVVDAAGSAVPMATSGELRGAPLPPVPLAAQGVAVGHIEMWSGLATHIGETERQVLETFAGQLALALERARLGEEAQQARLDAEASRIRAALFSSVTHDLRTPLASITASASSLLEEGVPFSEHQREELLRTILEESQRLNRLVANLMDLSRMKSGALVPDAEPVLIEDLVSSVVQRLRPLLVGRTVRTLIREDIPAVPMDVTQMDQVLTNVMENAIRYAGARGDITISATRWHDMVEVRVADRGPGIAAADRERVFDEFYRRDVGEQRGGTGLGLAIARAVVTGHGGKIWIEDTPGGGTTVGFRLPLHRQPAPAGTGS